MPLHPYFMVNANPPPEMGAQEIEAFLTHLALHEHVAASPQHRVLQAIFFLYCEVLGREITEPIQSPRARKPKRLHIVLVCSEAQNLLSCLSGAYTPDRPTLSLAPMHGARPFGAYRCAAPRSRPSASDEPKDRLSALAGRRGEACTRRIHAARWGRWHAPSRGRISHPCDISPRRALTIISK
jgi:hypothetical protein